MNQQKSPDRKNQEEKKKKNKRRISGASRPKPDLIILAYRERKRKKSRSALSLLTMQSLLASHRLSRDKKTQQASDLFFVSLFLVLFISDNSFIMTQPNARFLVEWPPLIRPLTATSSSPRSKNQVLKRR